MIQRKIGIRQRLGLNALGRIDDEHRALASGQRAGDFVIKIHMAGRIDEVQLICLPILCGIVELDGMRLNGDSALALQVHVVQQLLRHIALCNRLRQFE